MVRTNLSSETPLSKKTYNTESNSTDSQYERLTDFGVLGG